MSPMNQPQAPPSITYSGSFLGSLTRRDSVRGDPAAEAPKGPIGLTTLHDPGDKVVVDLVFVHGLNGGSQSTWSKNGDLSVFWPLEWLPKDEAFQDVRIHTFGYNSDLSRKSVLNVPDFAQALLNSIYDSPCIASGSKVPMILVGHSMGGLVIKKAYVLGNRTPKFHPMTRNIFAIFFLATPHLGAEVADTLRKLLYLAPGTRPFVQDLSPASPILQSINEEFPQYSSALQLFSFFESKPMRLGFKSQLIVQKHCAVLNYPNERRQYLNANHRDVARFGRRSDPSYLAIRNALATTIAGRRTLFASSRTKAGYEQKEKLSEFLGISMAPDEELESRDLRFPGTCNWFFEKPSFQQWRSASVSKTFWLRGRPGTGKSVLSANVIKNLKAQDQDCCFYFFTRGDKANATANSFLRSMAWQMATQHSEILEGILQIPSMFQASAINKVDHVRVWRQLYLNNILKVRLNKPQYWVIDALDECKTGLELLPLLNKMQELWPLCILITSRESVDETGASTDSRIEISSETIEEDDTTRDISLYLKCYRHKLPAVASMEPETMIEQMVQQSKGCFLWVSLVLKELQQVHTYAEIRKVLSTNTTYMDELYGRILNDMANAKFGKELAKAILMWTTFSARVLTIDELRCAIEFDIEDSVDDIERSISSCCGNLVYIDGAKKVRLLHLTLRDFLTREGMMSEFKIDPAGAHRRLALASLRCLTTEMRPSASRKLRVTQVQHQPFLANYACKYVFQHIFETSSTEHEVLGLLSKFLSSENVLIWIEYLAINGEVEVVFQAGKIINNLFNRLAQHIPLAGHRKQLSIFQNWGNDLIHLVTRFGKELSSSPSAIYQLIPPFCPIDSALHRQFCTPYQGLSVQGQSTNEWHDCLSIMNFAKPLCLVTVATSQYLFALGMSSGKVMVYNDATCQEMNAMDHGERVMALAFNDSGSMVASAGARTVRVWNSSNAAELFSSDIPSQCLSLCFDEEGFLLFAALKNNELRCWDVSANGALLNPEINWTTEFDEKSDIQYRQPSLALFSLFQHLLAIIYRGEDIILWDYESERVHDIYEKETGSRRHGSKKLSDGSTTVWSLQFATLNEVLFLVAAYSDGDLVIYNTKDGSVHKILTGINAHSISCSIDGRTLACSDSSGTIHLFDFETAKLLYRMDFEDSIAARAIAFSSDGYRIIDIRANQCRLWDPVVLQRQDLNDENSDTMSATRTPLEVSFRGVNSVQITTIETVSAGSVVFCGKQDGSVHVYDIATLKPASSELFVQTHGVSIKLLHFIFGPKLLATTDVASILTLRHVERKSRNRWEAKEPVIDVRIGENITAILSSAQHSRLLVTTDKKILVWSTTQDNSLEPLYTRDFQEHGQWLQNGADPESLLLVCADTIHIYRWLDLQCLHKVQLSNLIQPFTAMSRVISLRHARYFATMAVGSSRVNSTQEVIRIYKFNDSISEAGAVDCIHYLGTLSSIVSAIIGVFHDRLVFLDSNNWVCSSIIDGIEESNIRHFFIPNDWVSLVRELNMDITTNGEIVFVKRAELLVIKRGLEITDKGESSPRERSLSPRSTPFGIRGGIPLRIKSR